MNASEINTEIHKTIGRAIAEGIVEKKVSFETVIGIFETHKQALYDWRAAEMQRAMIAQHAKEHPLIVPPNRFQPPPRG